MLITQHFRKQNNKLINQPVSNRIISYSFQGIEVYLKVPVIIIIRFPKIICFGPMYIDIYQFQRWAGRSGLHGLPYISRLFFIKSEKLEERDIS